MTILRLFSLALASHSFVHSSTYVESHRESIYFASLLVVVVLVNNSFFTQFIHRPSKLESYVCSISLIHFFFMYRRVLDLAFLTGARMEKETNEEKRSHQRKLKSIDQFSFALSELFFLPFQSLELSECTTLIDLFKCVFQVALMMCNSTFSTTTKCAFPIFILNYFSLTCSFSLESAWKLYRAVSAAHVMKNCGKEAAEETSRKISTNPCQHFLSHTNISHKLTFIAF